MGIARNLLKTAAKRVSTRLMDKVGSRVVAMTTDTSSDPPKFKTTIQNQPCRKPDATLPQSTRTIKTDHSTTNDRPTHRNSKPRSKNAMPQA